MNFLSWILAVLLVLAAAYISVRALIIVPAHRNKRGANSRKLGDRTHLLVVLGSGGHTAEMLAMLENIELDKFTYRTYLVSFGDGFSAQKAAEFEEKAAQVQARKKLKALSKAPSRDVAADAHREALENTSKRFGICVVPRARNIHQSILTTPLSAINCLFVCLRVLRGFEAGYPDLILSNGPGTGVIVMLASYILKVLNIPGKHPVPPADPARDEDIPFGQMQSIYIESWARVKTLSLSGKILLRLGLADRFLVQWQSLVKATNGEAEYTGILI